jgi:hypothetical protein
MVLRDATGIAFVALGALVAVALGQEPPVPSPAGKAPATPSASVAPIKPAPLKADTEERQLPAAVRDACIGGGGRFFILHLPERRHLAIFDVNEARIVKFLSLASDNVKFAAGREKLFVVYADRGTLQRFSLATFEKEVTVQLAIAGTVKAVAVGSAAAGPLLVHYDKGRGGLDDSPVTFFDPVSLKELEFADQKGKREAGGVVQHSVRDAYHYRAGADGTVFGGWVTSHTQSMSSIVLMGKTARVYNGPMAGSVLPAADNTLVTAGGLFTPECNPRTGDKASPQFRLRVPSQGGPFYITCPGGGGAQYNTGEMETTKPVDVYHIGEPRSIATLKDVELPASNEAWTSSDFTQDKRVLFVPEGKLIAIIPHRNDRLLLHRFDVEEALTKAGLDYLFVISSPPNVVQPGTQFAYAPQVRSKKGGVKLKLESGPEGMSAAAEKLTWQVPKDFADDQAVVILTVSDASGKEIFHTFKLTVRP